MHQVLNFSPSAPPALRRATWVILLATQTFVVTNLLLGLSNSTTLLSAGWAFIMAIVFGYFGLRYARAMAGLSRNAYYLWVYAAMPCLLVIALGALGAALFGTSVEMLAVALIMLMSTLLLAATMPLLGRTVKGAIIENGQS